MRSLATFLLILIVPSSSSANDGAAGVAAGGVVLRNERRVAMETERLFISPERVRVEYEFVNHSNDEVVTEVAFPVPEYFWTPNFDGPMKASGYRFHAWVNGKEISVQADVRAIMRERDGPGRDVTSRLREAGVDVESFGEAGADPHANYGPRAFPVTAALPAATIQALQKEGLLGEGDEDLWPYWDVRVTYHWTQRFPPGATVRVAHEYRPQAGNQEGIRAAELDPACADPALRKRLLAQSPKTTGSATTWWVDYILTTANTRKTPIGRFELVVERPPTLVVSFCWDGKVEKTGRNTFRAIENNFVPKKDLTVYFFPVEATR